MRAGGSVKACRLYGLREAGCTGRMEMRDRGTSADRTIRLSSRNRAGGSMVRPAHFPILLVLLAGGSGCSLLANKTPTPAARINEAELAQLPPPPGVRFYLMLFGSHDLAHRPAHTHTWATLVRATEQPGAAPLLETHTISWLPTKLDINTLSLRIEPGVNVDLHATIRNSLRTRQDIAMWGPYEVWHGFAHRFLTQKEFLDSGVVGYQCIDNIGEAGWTGRGCDCIHAITDMDPVYPRWRYPLAFYGKPATANLVRRLMHSPIFIDPPLTHDWLMAQLGLCEYDIERRRDRGRVVPHEPGAPGLQAAPALPLPRAPVVPKTPTPKTAPDPMKAARAVPTRWSK